MWPHGNVHNRPPCANSSLIGQDIIYNILCRAVVGSQTFNFELRSL